MTKYKILALAIVVVITVATVVIKSNSLKETKTVPTSDTKPILSEPMSEERARSIAETSECISDGPLKENAFYNENSKTWWIDLDIDKPECNPACVIYEDETVEINWRCTGLTP